MLMVVPRNDAIFSETTYQPILAVTGLATAMSIQLDMSHVTPLSKYYYLTDVSILTHVSKYFSNDVSIPHVSPNISQLTFSILKTVRWLLRILF